MNAAPVIAFFPEASFGAALNCVGIAQELRRFGATPVFICHPGFTGIFAEYGFREYHLPALAENSVSEEDYWQSFIQTHLPHFSLSATEQLSRYVAPTWDAIVDTVETVETALTDLIRRIGPDLLVLDNVIMFPAIANAPCPWVRVVSCAETELPDPKVPPYLSGLSLSDAADCDRFRETYAKVVSPTHQRYNQMRKSKGLTPLPDGLFLETSPYLNLLLSPRIVRYERENKLPEPLFTFLDGCVRQEARFEPQVPGEDDAPLVYMSFGSLGAIDTGLIGRMLSVFANIPARFLVNVGAFGEAQQSVPDNVVLEAWFPQPSVVEHCDLFIHHGGNNSFCEALYFGVPSLLMPYCWDGFDNAQRAEATGTGKWLNRNRWTDRDLHDAIMTLLNDKAMSTRLQKASSQMQADRGVVRAAEAMIDVLSFPARQAV